jgi:hypothetical protein
MKKDDIYYRKGPTGKPTKTPTYIIKVTDNIVYYKVGDPYIGKQAYGNMQIDDFLDRWIKENPMKKRDSYNIYKGYEIKFYPERNIYIGHNGNAKASLSMLKANTLKELRQIIDINNDGINESYLSNPMKKKIKKRKNSAVRLNPAIDPTAYASNPLHFPKTKAGRPRKKGRPKTVKPTKIFGKGPKPNIKWWLVSLYRSDGNLIKVLAGQGTKANVMIEAEKLSKKRGVARAELQGPYRSMPSISTARH